MKKFKKVLLVTSAVLVVALGVVGCKKTTDCDFCGKEKKCSKIENNDGDEAWACADCEKEIEELKEAFGVK